MTLRTKRAKVLAVGAVAGVAAALTVGLSAPSGATPVASHGFGGNHVRLDRAFIIVLENHSTKGVIGDPNTPFITSLAFSVMLHIGTLVALLVYFRADWFRLVPAGIATIRDRSFRADPDRRLAWLLIAARPRTTSA